SPDSGQFSTVARYCGELDIVNKSYNVQPVGPTTTESSTDGVVPQFRVVNRVQQRLLLSPMGESLTKLHSWARNPENKTQDLDEQEKDTLSINVQLFFARLFWIIYYLYKDLGVYHRDLSEGNVLVRVVDGVPRPLLIDFDHARLRSDPLNDNMGSRTGTVPFMSILNLAGRSNQLSIADELESLFYLWSSVWLWAKGDPGTACLNAKWKDTSGDTAFTIVLMELQPEFKILKDIFLELREALFNWDGQEGTYVKTTSCGHKKRRRITGKAQKTVDEPYKDNMREEYYRRKRAATSNPSTDKERYFERLISRGKEADTILEKFAGIIEDCIPIPFK
ncbi:hypothetical protein IWQ62_006578, partial [Dispira parvispora]